MEFIYFFDDHPGSFFTSSFIIGLMIGSFLNVVIYRLPLMIERTWKYQCAELQGNPLPKSESFNLWLPYSHCPHCKKTIYPWENIPILSYLVLRGHCSRCKTNISPRYPLVELLTGMFSLVVALHFGITWEGLAALTLTYALIVLSLIDFDHQILPDDITLPFLWLGLILSLFDLFTDAHSSIIGAVAGYLFFWLIYQLFRILVRKEAMGYGDFKLLSMLGAWLGWKMLPMIILFSSFGGAIFGSLWLYFTKQTKETPLSFGPYIATSGWIALMWGDDINHLYLSLSKLG
ncbi:prepilin peptidase [Candidatus Nitrosacidococcus sp. I8]|uniref:prepilin peptidase n=1 Tax=Candidatus Nitrosacidococcus sp. I8 TaxID=2942908 RepID=UPI0022266750|nr:A24 family peptidase [Candidatus Nitrosacidococcus sp. I8]CAH9014692.1 Type 4 prepilin-like proteins leader peptide-processing enzyme [Candidatus Nitrosacidococcus sp. I8]